MFSLFGGGMVLSMGHGVPSQFIPTGGGGGGDLSTSNCGNEFDAYVRELEGPLTSGPFIFGPPRDRDLEFWKGRRCRFYLSKTHVVEAKVVEWSQGVTRNFMHMEIEWTLTLEGEGLLDLPTLDNGVGTHKQVTIDKKPKAHDGKTGIIVEDDLPGNRCKIQLDDDPLKFVTVHKDNLIQKPTDVHFCVQRMNVHGGGILRYCHCGSSTCRVPVYSIEWIDEASPAIDLFRGVAKATCPTCRAVEPTDKAFDDRDIHTTSASASPKKQSPAKKKGKAAKKKGKASPKQQGQEDATCCPICDMEKPLRTLQCGHQFCQDCWSQWRVKATSKMPSEVTQPEIDADELQKARDREYQKLRALLPHTHMDGTATKAPTAKRSSSRSTTVKRNKEAIDSALRNFFERLHSIFLKLDDMAHSNGRYEDGEYNDNLAVFWTELRKAPVHVFFVEDDFKEFMGEFCNMDGIEIMLQVIQERSEEIEPGRQLYLKSGWHRLLEEKRNAGGPASVPDGYDNNTFEEEAKGHIQNLMSICHNRMGELWEEDKEYHSAIYWYERAVFTQLKRLQLEGEQSDEDDTNHEIAKLYNNLALASKRAGKLSKAKDHYDRGLGYVEEETPLHMHLGRNKWTLQREVDEWTGTSGKLTPGC